MEDLAFAFIARDSNALIASIFHTKAGFVGRDLMHSEWRFRIPGSTAGKSSDGIERELKCNLKNNSISLKSERGARRFAERSAARLFHGGSSLVRS